MTGLLTDLMHERADALDRPAVDVPGLVREGDRRVRRRRAGVVAGVGVLGVVAALAVPALVGGGTEPTTAEETNLVAAFAAHSPSYAQGSEITIDGTTFDVGHTVRAFVQTDAGAVFSDPDGTVWFADGATVEAVGTINARVPHLVADGPRAAWVQPGGTPTYVVYDGATGASVEDAATAEPGMSDVKDGKDAAVVYALDGDVAYVRTPQGAEAWNYVTGARTSLDPEANGFTIIDAHDGRIAYERDDQGIFVGTDLEHGTKVDLWTAYSFSPDGRYLMGEPESDDVRIYDIAAGTSLPKDDLGYEYLGGYAWIDDDHYAAIGFTQTNGDGPIDVLSCAVSTGACDPVAKDIGTLDGGFTIPIGEYLS